MNSPLAQILISEVWTTSGAFANISLGCLLGALGQTARMIVGLKKTNDEAKARQTSFSDQFDVSQLMVSLIIGAVAGALASMILFDKMESVNREVILALFAAGYAGADFIEGFMRDEAANAKFTPSNLSPPPSQATAGLDQARVKEPPSPT
jgi:hypothetical protein